MAKERKKQREEETAVCLVEWASSKAETDGKEGKKENESKVLVMKRPEKGENVLPRSGLETTKRETLTYLRCSNRIVPIQVS